MTRRSEKWSARRRKKALRRAQHPTDSKGNLYTTESYEGKRIQKFVYKGMAPVRSKDQGVLWPTTSR